MKECLQEWIGLYYDGELPDERRRQVESHLLECPTCRAELAALEQLSRLLQADPAPAARTSPERFAAQVRLRLPGRAQAQRLRAQWLRRLWWLIPFGVLGAQAFFHAALIVSALVWLALALNQALPPAAWASPAAFGGLLALEVGISVGSLVMLGGWVVGSGKWRVESGEWAVGSRQ